MRPSREAGGHGPMTAHPTGLANPFPRVAPSGTGNTRSVERRERVNQGIRIVNVSAACLGIIATLPLMALIALAIKLTSPGPVLFTQERIGIDTRSGVDRRKDPRGSGAAGRRRIDRNGRNLPDSGGRRQEDRGGRIFRMYKFRTMTLGEDTSQVWAQENDPRVTRIGAVLRKYRLDELPQLFNVLKGDMNIVGPRPEQPDIFQDLRTRIDQYPQRQRVLPGITGWAQINLHYDQCLDDVKAKVSYDLKYIERRSASEDIRIMVRTIPVMIKKKGAV